MDKQEFDTRVIEQLLETGQHAKVVEICEAIQIEAKLPKKFWYLKARALEALGKTLPAIECYRSEIASVNRVPPILLAQVGQLLDSVGRYRAAAMCFREVCELEPSAEYLVLLASVLSCLGRKAEARDTLRRALDDEPTYDEAWHNLGAELMDDCPAEAEAAFRRALEIDPERIVSYGALGKACLAQGRIEEGIQAAQEGLKRQPLSGLCHFVVGEGMEANGNIEGAEAAYFKAYRCDDYDKGAALLSVAHLCERTGRLKRAVAFYERGLMAWPDDDRIRDEVAAFVERQGRSAPEISDLCGRYSRLLQVTSDPPNDLDEDETRSGD